MQVNFPRVTISVTPTSLSYGSEYQWLVNGCFTKELSEKVAILALKIRSRPLRILKALLYCMAQVMLRLEEERSPHPRFLFNVPPTSHTLRHTSTTLKTLNEYISQIPHHRKMGHPRLNVQ